MFYCLTGNVVRIDLSAVVIECGGVGFLCSTTSNTINSIGTKRTGVTLYTYLNVKEDALDLYGFYDEGELDCFRMLLSVTGVGPKAALSILSELSADKLALCVASGDSKSITKAQGVGKKIAERIVLELKDKFKADMPVFAGSSVEAAAVAVSSSNTAEAVAALTSLGYSQSDAAVAIGNLDSSLPTDELIRQGLRRLASSL